MSLSLNPSVRFGTGITWGQFSFDGQDRISQDAVEQAIHGAGNNPKKLIDVFNRLFNMVEKAAVSVAEKQRVTAYKAQLALHQTNAEELKELILKGYQIFGGTIGSW